MRVVWGATAPTRHALQPSVITQWVSRRSDSHQIVAKVARIVGLSRFAGMEKRSIRNRASRLWARSPKVIGSVALSRRRRADGVLRGVANPLKFNANDVLAALQDHLRAVWSGYAVDVNLNPTQPEDTQ